MSFRRNLHAFDRALRIVAGAGCFYLGFVDTSVLGNAVINLPVGVFGIINLFAAIFSYCPVYGLTGISTYRATERNSD